MDGPRETRYAPSMYVRRLIPIQKALQRKSVLLLGPRRTGKSALVQKEVQAARVYNLLQSDVFQRLSQRPSLIRESLTPRDRLIVIDDIQKLPVLMDEVHAMIEETPTRFLLTGSSARKLRRSHTSLMAGRAKSLRLFPFVSAEIEDFDLKRALNFGTLPPVYLSDDPWDELSTYVGDYLKEEILAEALTRRIENFSRFLHTAALTNGELVNFEAVASDAQVPARTVREYYALVGDTLMGNMIRSIEGTRKRKAISTGKFYFFDVGVLNSLMGRKSLPEGSPEHGKALEHLLYLELKAYSSYSGKEAEVRFWRTYQGDEVDFVVEPDAAIEVKATRLVTERHLKGFQAIQKVRRFKRRIVVSRDPEKRVLEGIEIHPVLEFLKELWGGGIF